METWALATLGAQYTGAVTYTANTRHRNIISGSLRDTDLYKLQVAFSHCKDQCGGNHAIQKGGLNRDLTQHIYYLFNIFLFIYLSEISPICLECVMHWQCPVSCVQYLPVYSTAVQYSCTVQHSTGEGRPAAGARHSTASVCRQPGRRNLGPTSSEHQHSQHRPHAVTSSRYRVCRDMYLVRQIYLHFIRKHLVCTTVSFALLSHRHAMFLVYISFRFLHHKVKIDTDNLQSITCVEV